MPTTASAAERRIFGLLEATVAPEAVAFHSLRIARHEQKPSAEADFVVVRPDAVIVIEVKGGRVRQQDGVWYYRDRHGVDHPSREGPFRQAEGAMYGLRARLEELLGSRVLDGMAFGFVVATPDCSLSVANVEWDREMLIDESTVRGLTDLSVPLRRAVGYWRDRRRMPAGRTATDAETQAVIKACRPDFEPVRSLGASASSVAAEMLRLTEQQYGVLDLLAQWQRVVIEGGAGTGKTLLGAEAARRATDAGQRVLLTCQSPALASWLRTRLPDTMRVVPHRALPSVVERADLLICDEAQDLLNEKSIELLDRLVWGGLDTGRWLLLLDPNYQSDVLGTFDETVYELVTSRADGRPLCLSANVRNTEAILNEVQLVTGARLERPLVTGEGTVRADFPHDPSEEADLIREWLRDLRREEVPAGSVTILVPAGAPRFLDHLPAAERSRILLLGTAGASDWPLKNAQVASVPDFKGLENDVVVLADLWDLGIEENRNLLYVAMTRSRTELRVAWPAHLRATLEDLKTRNTVLLGSGT